MSDPPRSFLSQQMDQAKKASKDVWRIMLDRGPSQMQFWFIALLIGIGLLVSAI